MSDVTPILPTTINGCDASGPTPARPKSPDKGQPFYDIDTGEMLIFDGTGWAVMNCKGKCKDCDKCDTPSVPPVPTEPPAPPAEPEEPAPNPPVPTEPPAPPAEPEEPAPNPPATPTQGDMPTS